MNRARSRTRAVAIIVAALFAAAPAGAAQADICGAFGPGYIGPGPCYPPGNTNTDDTPPSVSTWPPGADYGGGGDGGNGSGGPIVTPAATP
jgi:hypothetical protein